MAKLIIVAQYHENYNTDTVFPQRWKSKGGVNFEVNMDDRADSDLLVWAFKDDIVAACIEFLRTQNNDMCRYEYVEHEVQYHEPEKVDPKAFVEMLKKQLEKQQQG